MRKLISIGFVCAFTLSCLLAVNFSSQTAKASTMVSSDITTDTTWYAASSPYVISTNVAVTSGVTLTIEPGVTVKFSAGSKLTVAGNLNAVGTSISMINFTSDKPSPAPGDYNTTVFTGGSTSTFIMEYCNVQYAKNGVTLASLGEGRYNIQNCEISQNQNSGIYITQQDSNHSFIQDNQISSNPTGIDVSPSLLTDIATSVHGITILQNTLEDNNQNGIYIYAYDYNIPYTVYIYDINITGNTISGVTGNDIYIYADTSSVTSNNCDNAFSYIFNITIIGNTVSGAGQNGIYLYSNSMANNTHWMFTDISHVDIIGNTVTGAGGNGISVISKAYICSWLDTVYIIGNTVINNGGTGIDCYSNGARSYIAVTITSNQIESNTRGIIIEGTPAPGVGPAIEANITRNTICHNTNEGVEFLDYYNYVGDKAHYNDIYSNGQGMTIRIGVGFGGTANATYNWWGDSSGPHNDISNPSGTGNPTNSDNLNLTFIPWLTAPFNTTSPNNSAPNTPSAPTGPTSVYTGISHQYTITATDPDGDMIRYGWDWNGDGVVDEWSGLVPSGTSDVRSHSWSSSGVYNISVIVEDEFGAQSGWSAHLQVTVQNAPVPEFTPQVLIVTVTLFAAIFVLVRKRRPSGF